MPDDAKRDIGSVKWGEQCGHCPVAHSSLDKDHVHPQGPPQPEAKPLAPWQGTVANEARRCGECGVERLTIFSARSVVASATPASFVGSVDMLAPTSTTKTFGIPALGGVTNILCQYRVWVFCDAGECLPG